jgi:hypothetical protein
MYANPLHPRYQQRLLPSSDGSFEFAPGDTAYQSQDSQTANPLQLDSIASYVPRGDQPTKDLAASGLYCIADSLGNSARVPTVTFFRRPAS